MQFKEFAIKRELNKAYCGFYSSEKDGVNIPVATGNWGCGAFRGYNRLKCLIQLIACAANKRNLVYYTFNDFELLLEMEEMFEFLQVNEITIAQLWKYLTSFNGTKDFTHLYHHIHEQFLADKELEGLDSAAFEKCTQDILEERIDSKDEIEEEQKESTDCVIDIPEQNEEVLENPTKKLKIDDEIPNASESIEDQTNAAITFLEPPPKNKLITDYFTKTPK
jgi:poly(ADP-ribose) glycohydrolase